MIETALLARITVNPKILDGKPIVRGRRLAVKHVLGLLAAGELAVQGHDVVWVRDWPSDPGDEEILDFAHRTIARP